MAWNELQLTAQRPRHLGPPPVPAIQTHTASFKPSLLALTTDHRLPSTHSAEGEGNGPRAGDSVVPLKAVWATDNPESLAVDFSARHFASFIPELGVPGEAKQFTPK